MTLVLDASAIVSLLIADEHGAAVAEAIRRDDDLPWTLPLVDGEVGNALCRLDRRGTVEASRAGRALQRFARMPLIRTGHTSLFAHAWALRANLSFYDALYVALAAKLEAPLLTLDRRLASSPKLPARVIVPG